MSWVFIHYVCTVTELQWYAVSFIQYQSRSLATDTDALHVNLRLPVPSMIFESSESISFKVEFNLFLKILLPGIIFLFWLSGIQKKGINKSFEIMHSSWTFEIFNVLKLWSLLLFSIELIMVTGKDYRFNIESGYMISYILIKHIFWVKTVFCIIKIPGSISTIRMSHWFPVIGTGYFR